MLASDAVRALALAVLAVVVWRNAAFWPIPLLAFVEGAGDTFFGACLGGVLRSVVPPPQLPAAVSVQQGRVAVVGIVGPPAGGALFAVARALPFGVDALVVRLLVRRDLCDANAVPAAARTSSAADPRRPRGGLPLPLDAALPARDVVLLRRRELHDPGAPLRRARRRAPPRPDGRRDRDPVRALQRVHPRRLDARRQRRGDG